MAGHLFTVPVVQLACTDVAKCKVGVFAPANIPIIVYGLSLNFDGTDATKGPGLIEICSCTNATAGTYTPVTPVNTDSGRPETIQSTGTSLYTAEPTVLTVERAFTVPTCMGSAVIFLPFGKGLTARGGYGWLARITLPTGVTVNFTGGLNAEE